MIEKNYRSHGLLLHIPRLYSFIIKEKQVLVSSYQKKL